MLVPTSVMVTVAPGTDEPDVSVTVPTSEPRVACAHVIVGTSAMAMARQAPIVICCTPRPISSPSNTRPPTARPPRGDRTPEPTTAGLSRNCSIGRDVTPVGKPGSSGRPKVGLAPAGRRSTYPRGRTSGPWRRTTVRHESVGCSRGTSAFAEATADKSSRGQRAGQVRRLRDSLDSDAYRYAAPTITLRTRIQGAPCEMWLICTGCPLASPVVPCISHDPLLETASRLP